MFTFSSDGIKLVYANLCTLRLPFLVFFGSIVVKTPHLSYCIYLYQLVMTSPLTIRIPVEENSLSVSEFCFLNISEFCFLNICTQTINRLKKFFINVMLVLQKGTNVLKIKKSIKPHLFQSEVCISFITLSELCSAV